MSRDELKILLDAATAQERAVLDRVASGYSKGFVTARRIAFDLNLDYAGVVADLNKFMVLDLVTHSWQQGYYLSSRLSEYVQLRADSNFA